jgi:hypothetical protein
MELPRRLILQRVSGKKAVLYEHMQNAHGLSREVYYACTNMDVKPHCFHRKQVVDVRVCGLYPKRSNSNSKCEGFG